MSVSTFISHHFRKPSHTYILLSLIYLIFQSFPQQFVPAKANEVPLQLRFGELSDFSSTCHLVVELNWDETRKVVQKGARDQAHI